jgi:hypothetical protein
MTTALTLARLTFQFLCKINVLNAIALARPVLAHLTPAPLASLTWGSTLWEKSAPSNASKKLKSSYLIAEHASTVARTAISVLGLWTIALNARQAMCWIQISLAKKLVALPIRSKLTASAKFVKSPAKLALGKQTTALLVSETSSSTCPSSVCSIAHLSTNFCHQKTWGVCTSD